jgi:hypothetical protein
MLQNRTYFFNVKENRMGDLYLNIVESKNRDAGGFERQSVILFAEDLQEFLQGFDDSLRVMEKALRERKRSGYRRGRPGDDPGEGRIRGGAGNRGNYGSSGDYGSRNRGSDEGRGSFRPGGDNEYRGEGAPHQDNPARKPRRLVAKKTWDKDGENGPENRGPPG